MELRSRYMHSSRHVVLRQDRQRKITDHEAIGKQTDYCENKTMQYRYDAIILVIPYHFNKLFADMFQKSTKLGTHVRYVKCITHMKYE